MTVTLVRPPFKRTKTVTCRIPVNLDTLLERLTKNREYRSKSDLLREAIIEYLEHIGVQVDPEVPPFEVILDRSRRNSRIILL